MWWVAGKVFEEAAPEVSSHPNPWQQRQKLWYQNGSDVIGNENSEDDNDENGSSFDMFAEAKIKSYKQNFWNDIT